jgi:CTP-dependent riboflavin kinase
MRTLIINSEVQTYLSLSEYWTNFEEVLQLRFGEFNMTDENISIDKEKHVKNTSTIYADLVLWLEDCLWDRGLDLCGMGEGRVMVSCEYSDEHSVSKRRRNAPLAK